MTPRERIIAALEHRETDQVPIDFAGTDCSSVHIAAYDRLRKHVGIEPGAIRLACLFQLVAEVEPEMQDRFGADAKALYFYPRQWRRWESGYGFDVEVPELWRPERLDDGRDVFRDGSGVIRLTRPAGGLYFDPVSFIFADIKTPDEFDAHEAVFQRWDWPTADDESVAEYAVRAKSIYESTDRAVVASWRMHYLQAGQILRGYEQFMVDLLVDEPLVRGLFDRLHVAYMERIKTFLEAIADYTDIIFFADDLGTQRGPLVGPDVYRKLVKPYWKELIALVKAYDKKVVMHACGAISDFIPDLIEMGVDAINPVQITAQGMEPERLKRDFGNDIAFWGGGISTQGVLDGCKPEEIRDAVKRNVDIFAPGGGFVFTQVHNIQYNVPPENIVAAYDAARG